uniref:Retrovirus-related Pol polyprotein from transposon TNT 1-94 n=1 Tax=Tanacetum cinerariifolium TaxID=118510 RepID=A0A6L2M6J2_TANCI|nr:retrovirus-related Pol polyprotein from transposon TNT 1-94 [Tanacetum cinerariifolium]
MSKVNSEKGLVAESFDQDEESVSSEDERPLKSRHLWQSLRRSHLLGRLMQDMDEISYLKRVIEKWNCSRVTLDQMLSEQIPGNIVKAFEGRGKRKEKISKEVIFTKPDESSSVPIHEITSNSKSECETQEPIPPLPKLIGDEPAGTSNSLISLADLTLNMADLTLNTYVPRKTKPTSDKVSPTHAIKKRTVTKSPTVPVPQPKKKVDLFAEKLLLTLMDEVKSLKIQIKVPSDNSLPVSQTGSLKSSKGKQTTWFGPCKHCGFKNHLAKDCYIKSKCFTCGSTDQLTKEHLEQTVVNKTLTKLKAYSYVNPSAKKAPMIPKPFKEVRGYSAHECLYVNFLFEMEPKKLIEALEEEGWIIAMQEELNQFIRNKMDVKSEILNGKILEEVYVQQPLRVESSNFSNHVYKLHKSLYELKQAPGAWYQANTKESHLVAVKRIFIYLKGTPNLGLWYPKGLDFDLKVYSNLDYAGCNMDRKSTSGGCQIRGGKLVCWSGKKQSSTTMSSVEVEETVKVGLETLGIPDENDTSLSSSDLINSSPPVTLPKAPTDLKPKKKRISPFSKSKTLKLIKNVPSKKPVTETRPIEKTVATADATQSLRAFESADDQGNQHQIANAEKVQEIIVEKAKHVVEEDDLDKGIDSSILSMGNVRLKDVFVNNEENLFDTESKIKVVKRFQPQPNDEDQIVFLGPVYDDMYTDTNVFTVKTIFGSLYCLKDVDPKKAKTDLVSMPEDDNNEEAFADLLLDELQRTKCSTLDASTNKNAFSNPFGYLHKEIISFTSKIGTSIRKKVGNEMDEVCDKLKYFTKKIDKYSIHMTDLVNLIQDMVHLLDSALVFRKANAEGEKWEKANPDLDSTGPNLYNTDLIQGEQLLKNDEMRSVQEEKTSVQKVTSSEHAPLITERVPPVSNALVVHTSEENTSK